MTYRAPVQDLAFSLFEVAGMGALQPHMEGFDRELVEALLEPA